MNNLYDAIREVLDTTDYDLDDLIAVGHMNVTVTIIIPENNIMRMKMVNHDAMNLLSHGGKCFYFRTFSYRGRTLYLMRLVGELLSNMDGDIYGDLNDTTYNVADQGILRIETVDDIINEELRNTLRGLMRNTND